MRFKQPEAAFQRSVVTLARLLGWFVVEMPRYVRRCPRCGTDVHFRLRAGVPDLPYLLRDGRLLVREIKGSDTAVSPEQDTVLDALRAAGVDAKVWRAGDMDAVERELR